MVKIKEYKKITNKKTNKSYGIFGIKYKEIILPIILDWDDFIYIKKLNKSWFINDNGGVSADMTINGKHTIINIHEIVMALKNNNNINKSIIHLNKLGIDNRSENLIYNDKNVCKSLKKKKRTIEFDNSEIEPDEIPTYVSYIKPSKYNSYCERFQVKIGDIRWNSTGSKNHTLRYKLEETKKFLRDLRDSKPELFDKYSMNGSYTKKGKILLDEFYDIVEKCGYKIKHIKTDNNEDYLKPKLEDINSDEINSISNIFDQ